MIALITTVVVALAGSVGAVLYGKRRPLDAHVSWGGAMLAATIVFFLMFWWYGVVPHQWLMLADNEWGWRSDRLLVGPGNVLEVLPFEVTYLVARDFIVLGIYGVATGLNLWHWAAWNDRKKKAQAQAAAELPASQYGRPLVRKA